MLNTIKLEKFVTYSFVAHVVLVIPFFLAADLLFSNINHVILFLTSWSILSFALALLALYSLVSSYIRLGLRSSFKFLGILIYFAFASWVSLAGSALLSDLIQM